MNKDSQTAKPKKPELLDYVANADGWVAGQRVKEDDPIKLTAEAARYENVRKAGSPKTEPVKVAKPEDETVKAKPADKVPAPKGKGEAAK